VGLAADLEGVRDLCATGVDGTSIDVLTDLAVACGLRWRQVVVPVDHLGAVAGGLLPAVVVTELPGKLLHFVVVWGRKGRWVEVMDPASGRRWVTLASLRRDLYRHEMTVGTSA